MAVLINTDTEILRTDREKSDDVLTVKDIAGILGTEEESLVFDWVSMKTAIIIYDRASYDKNEFASFITNYPVYGPVMFISGKELPDTDFLIKMKNEGNSILTPDSFDDIFISTIIVPSGEKFFRQFKEKHIMDMDTFLKSDRKREVAVAIDYCYYKLIADKVIDPKNTVLVEDDKIYMMFGDDYKEQIQKMIKYYEGLEEYEKCAELLKLKFLE